jgi:hypothetical protein
MIEIRQEQIEVLSKTMLKHFEQRMVLHLQSRFPEQAGKMADEALQTMIQEGIKSAAKYKIEVEADVQRYLEFMFELCPDFDTIPQTAWAQEILRREELWPWDKLDEIENHAALLMRGGR